MPKKMATRKPTLAIEAFALSLKKMIGGYVALMGGLDALVFSGGIGERDPMTRAQVCAGMEVFGLTLDPEANNPTHAGPKTISRPNSKVAVYVLPADEDRIIAEHSVAPRGGRIICGKPISMPSTGWDRRPETRCPALQSCAVQLPLPRSACRRRNALATSSQSRGKMPGVH